MCKPIDRQPFNDAASVSRTGLRVTALIHAADQTIDDLKAHTPEERAALDRMLSYLEMMRQQTADLRATGERLETAALDWETRNA
jgi:hypothetical protein